MTNLKTPKQLNDLGDQYFYGKGVTKNLETAFTYYKKAADLNNPVGYFNVAKYFIEKENYKQAAEYLLKAKDLKYTQANKTLANMHLVGQGVKKRKKKAFKMIEDAVALRDMSAISILGSYYQQGIGCKKSEVKALDLYKESANAKQAEGMYLLGKLLLEGKQIKRDFENGFFWLDQAAEHQHIEAMVFLKHLYETKHPFLRKKSLLYLEEMAFYYDELHAKTGDIEALKRVASVYYTGTAFMKTNDEKCVKYYEMLKEKDVTEGYTGMGLLRLYGKGVKKDEALAKEYLEIASTRSDVSAKNALGDIYRLGLGVNVNYQRAKDYYTEAAKNEETNAFINLGLLNYRHQINNSSPKLALQYMKQAAEKDNALAYYWLGIFYDKGIGEASSFQKAETYFLKAIEAGVLGAKYKYAQLLIDQIEKEKMSKKKRSVQFIKARDLLFDYMKAPNTSDVNTTYTKYLLGTLYQHKDFPEHSKKIARYYFELASEKNLAKAMVQMYHILYESETKRAISILEEALSQPNDGEPLYEMALLLLEGNEWIVKDELKAKEYLGKAASLQYTLAKEKLAMM